MVVFGCCNFDGVERPSDVVCADEDRGGDATDMAAEAAAVRMPAAALTAPLATDEIERRMVLSVELEVAMVETGRRLFLDAAVAALAFCIMSPERVDALR